MPPTCTEDGYTEHTCSVCGDSYKDTPVEALGHDYSEETIVPPTCTEDGYTEHTCSVCGDSYKDAFVPAPGHTESDWIIDQEPTADSEGSKHKECLVCKKILETQTIDKLEVMEPDPADEVETAN